MNLETRRPIVPPEPMIAALRALTHTPEYRELPPRGRTSQ
jgi:hypothetical protein